MKLILLLLTTFFCFSQENKISKDTITVCLKFEIVDKQPFLKDTMYICKDKTRIRASKDTLYIMANRQYLKVKRK